LKSDLLFFFLSSPPFWQGETPAGSERRRFAIASTSREVHFVQQLSCHSTSPKVGKNTVFLLIDSKAMEKLDIGYIKHHE
jgi:hypothetical protein